MKSKEKLKNLFYKKFNRNL